MVMSDDFLGTHVAQLSLGRFLKTVTHSSCVGGSSGKRKAPTVFLLGASQD